MSLESLSSQLMVADVSDERKDMPGPNTSIQDIPAIQLFGLKFNSVTPDEALQLIHRWITNNLEGCRVVVTPNVDHVVRMQSNAAQKAAYDAASLVVADGWPIVAVSRLLKRPLPGRVAGSDIVPALLSSWPGPLPLRVFLLGAAPGVAERAAGRIHASCPHCFVCGTYSPPMGFENNSLENNRIFDKIEVARPDLVVVGFGAPKQEIWLHINSHQLHAKVAIAAGGTIDFLAGKQVRAPLWMQKLGMEWLHRLLSDPRRLAGRYLYDAWVFPRIVLREFFSRTTAKP